MVSFAQPEILSHAYIMAQDKVDDRRPRPPPFNRAFELPPLQNHMQANESFPPFHSPRPRELLPSMMARSPPGRSSTLPPIQRPRPRKSSVTQNARKAKHERTKSKEQVRRMSIEGRKAFSAEPQGPAASAMGKRWEDLIEAATSATEADSDRDLTPVSTYDRPLVQSLKLFPTLSSSGEIFDRLHHTRHCRFPDPQQSNAPRFPPSSRDHSPTTKPTKPPHYKTP